MNQKRYYRNRYHCFPTVLATVAKVVVLVAVILSPMVSCGVVTLMPRKYSSHETITVSRQPAVGTRPCRITTRSPAADKGHYRFGTSEKGYYRFTNMGTRSRHKLFVARLEDVTTDEAETSATETSATDASTTAANGGSAGGKPSKLPRCFKIKFTTLKPTTKRWSPKIRKCSTTPDTGNGTARTTGTTSAAGSDEKRPAANSTGTVDEEDGSTSVVTTSAEGDVTVGTVADGNATATADSSACDDDATNKVDDPTTATDGGNGTETTDGWTATAVDAANDEGTATAVPTTPSADRVTVGRKGRKTTHRRKPSKTTAARSKPRSKPKPTGSPVKSPDSRPMKGGGAQRRSSAAKSYRPCDGCDYYV